MTLVLTNKHFCISLSAAASVFSLLFFLCGISYAANADQAVDQIIADVSLCDNSQITPEQKARELEKRLKTSRLTDEVKRRYAEEVQADALRSTLEDRHFVERQDL